MFAVPENKKKSSVNYETDPRKNMQIHLDFCGQITFITYSFYNWRPYTLS